MQFSGEADPLINELQRDSVEAFDALYAAYHQAVYRNICKFIHRHEIAEDLLQEVFMALWQHRFSLDPCKPAANWLFVVSYNKAVSWIKKDLSEHKALRGLAPYLSAQQDQPYSEQLVQSQLEAIHTAADLLPLRKKQAFQLCRIEGRSYEEAGTILGISSETVKEYVKASSSFIRHSIVTRDPSLPGVIAIAIFISQYQG